MTRPPFRHPRPVVARSSLWARLNDGLRGAGHLIVIGWYAALTAFFFYLASALLRAAGWF